MNKITKTQTYWNGVPTTAERGTAIVADVVVGDPSRFPEYWARTEGIVGTRIPVVRVVLIGVHYGHRVTYLDDRNGEGWDKVTEGLGSPKVAHKNVSIGLDSFEATP